MDLTDPDSIREAVSSVIEKEGRIDVLINNAGMHTGGPVETLPAEYIKLQMDTNLWEWSTDKGSITADEKTGRRKNN